MTNSVKVTALLEDSGFNSLEEFLDSPMANDSVVPGICIRKNCDYTTDVESDADRSYCEKCGTKSVKSIMVLLGLI